MNRGRRMNRLFACRVAAAVAAAVLAGEPRVSAGEDSPPSARPEAIAVRASNPVRIDGRLDEAVWSRATAYPLSLPRDAAAGGTLSEPGSVRVAWDDAFVYFAFDFTDSDVAAEGTEDQLRQQNFGDVAEIFLKPAGQASYWELHATPLGKKSTFFFPSRGRQLPSSFLYSCGLVAVARVHGTANNWRDRDKGWTAEVAMPWRDLAAEGGLAGAGARWTMLAGRYNYSRHLDGPEISSFPGLSRTLFHLTGEYADLVFVDSAGEAARPTPGR